MSLMQIMSPSPKNKTTDDSLQIWRESVFNSILTAIAIAGSVAYFAEITLAYKSLSWPYLLMYTIAYLVVLGIAFLKRIPAHYRMAAFVVIFFVLGITTAIESAAIGDARVWLLGGAIFAAVFLGKRAGIGVTVFSTLTWMLLGYLFNTGVLERPFINQFSVNIWAGTGVTFLIIGLMLVLTIAAILVNLNKTVQESYALAQRTAEQSNQLQLQSKILERRSSFLEASIRVSHAVAPLLDSQEILNETVTQIVKEFNFKHVGIFLIREDRRILMLEAEAGRGDYALPAGSYRLNIGDDMAGSVIITQRAYTYQAGDNERGEKLNIALPGTQSQAALPLRESQGVMGVLTLQSERERDFGDAALATLQFLADQIGAYLENARLLLDREEAISAQQRAYGDLTEIAWQEYSELLNKSGFRRDKRGFSVVEADEQYPTGEQAEAKKVPITIRGGRTIGHVCAKKADGQAWTAHEEDLLATLTSRLETVIDSARLYTEAQRRAERERVVGEVTTRIRETLNIERVLETAAQELHKILGNVETEVWLDAE